MFVFVSKIIINYKWIFCEILLALSDIYQPWSLIWLVATRTKLLCTICDIKQPTIKQMEY
jgi:hypothetical protein